MKLGLEIDEIPGWYPRAALPTADLIVGSSDPALRNFLVFSSNSLPVHMHFFDEPKLQDRVQIHLEDPESEQGKTGARALKLHRSNGGDREVRVQWDPDNRDSRAELHRLIKELASP